MGRITPMKQLYWLALVFCAIAWVGSVAWILITIPLSWPLAALVLLSGGFVVTALWLHYHTLPIRTGQKIVELAQSIQALNTERLTTLTVDDQPTELRPLIEAFNRFLKLEQERLQHEHAFSSEASHQLRTPLAGIRLQAQIAQRVTDDEKRTKALDNIIKAIDRNTHLVEQLLDYSRLTSFRHAASTPSIHLETESKDLLAKYAEKAQSNNIQFEHRIVPELPQISCAAHHMDLMLKNLLDNALRYTPDSGQVMVNIEALDSGVKLSVEDSGPGIAPDQISTVQSPFQTSSSGKKHGTGLGLAIVKRITEIYGATLELGSSPLGGLRASVVLKT
ncbi:MAG: hypothetical protein C9356_10195 [Oleiphilus sp.]|nr:MAG: hypothetical protein C9356_10195 [Oleiphilus sp.]